MSKFAGGKPQAIALFLALLTTIFATLHFRNIERENAFKDFEVLATEGTDALNARLTQYEVALEGLSGLFNVAGTPDRQTVRDYVHSLQLDRLLPGINGIGYIEYVERDRLDAFMAEVATLGFEGFEIHPPSEQDALFVIKYIEPYEGNEEALGLDIAFEEGRRSAAISARDSGEARLTPRILLVQDDTKTPGFLLLRPYYQPGASIDTVEERRAAFLGWVYAPFVGARTLTQLTSSQDNNYSFSVFDGGAADPDMLIFASAAAANSDHEPLFKAYSQLELYGRTWTIEWGSLPDFEASKSSRAHIVVLFLGLLLTALLWVLLQNLARRQQTVEVLVREKTTDLEVQKTQNESILNNPLLAILITDANGNIKRRNDAADRILGLGQNGASSLLTVLPDLVGMEAGTQKRTHLRIDGEKRILSVKKNDWQTPDGSARSTFFVRDITEAENAAAAAAETEKRLDMALTSSEIGVFEIDLTTGKSIVSDMWKRIMRVPMTEGDFDAQSYFLASIDPDDFRVLKANDTACIQGHVDRTMSEYRVHLEGGTRWMRSDAFVSSRDEDGTALKMVGTQIDITASKEMDRVKNEFIATVSHELRTPITSVKGAIGLLQNMGDLPLPDSARRLLGIAQINVDRLTELVNDILDLERVQTGNMRMEFKDISVNSLLRDAREQILPFANSENVEIVVEPDPSDPVVSMDRSRMLQILGNLLSNACKFAPDGTTVTLGAEQHDVGPRFYVRDQGPGVPPGFVPSLFEPFTQADNSDTREKSGTGLGLSIAREIVERMSGHIGYRRTDDDLTEFWITLTDMKALDEPKAALRLVK